MSAAVLVELAVEAAGALLHDARVHPRKGDVLDDDPPLVPLTVIAVHPNDEFPVVVVAERREWWQAQLIVRGRWRGSLTQWQREMKGAVVRGQR